MKKNITLRVDSKLYDEFQEFCKVQGFVISRKFEIFMEEQMKLCKPIPFDEVKKKKTLSGYSRCV
jgi:antitoxin component of RelBE/YafQ-DinJ toxin-antitoxin module